MYLYTVSVGPGKKTQTYKKERVFFYIAHIFEKPIAPIIQFCCIVA